jgi:RNA polymerase subunit RPABC4/transcription elongation factor Spt4
MGAVTINAVACPQCGAPTNGRKCPYCRTLLLVTLGMFDTIELCPNCGDYDGYETARLEGDSASVEYWFCRSCGASGSRR